MTDKTTAEIVPSPADVLDKPASEVWSIVKRDRQATDQEIEKLNTVMMEGNYNKLSERERTLFMYARCVKDGLDPLKQPFDWIETQGKLKPYANKSASEQFAAKYRVSVAVLEKGYDGDSGTYDVWVRASGPDGRFVDNLGSVPVAGKLAKDLSNAKKAALTQATRRAVLEYCGQGTSDESELAYMNGNGDGPKRVAAPQPYQSAVGGYSSQRAIPTAVPTDQLPPPPGPAKAPSAVIPTAKPKA